MRIIHRYLGFFLAGIMAVYALSGIIMIFRETAFLKRKTIETIQLDADLHGGELSPKLRMGVKIDRTEGEVLYFKDGNYNTATGVATVKKMKLPLVLEKMERLHKATTNSPLYFLNIIFGTSLLFFVISAFWMYTPKASVFKKGLYFSLVGTVLTLLMLFL
jgi:uncharacterized iron-regulated membrane protein